MKITSTQFVIKSSDDGDYIRGHEYDAIHEAQMRIKRGDENVRVVKQHRVVEVTETEIPVHPLTQQQNIYLGYLRGKVIYYAIGDDMYGRMKRTCQADTAWYKSEATFSLI